jgi:hypothetical protein
MAGEILCGDHHGLGVDLIEVVQGLDGIAVMDDPKPIGLRK